LTLRFGRRIAGRRKASAALWRRHLIEACAILSRAIEVIVGWDAQALGGREKRASERIDVARIGNAERAARPVVARKPARIGAVLGTA
jgi:hypothetical protein